MACRFTYNGKTYEEAEFKAVLKRLPLNEASKFVPGVQSIPDAPYKGTAWAELGLKRALIEAVESGADEVTWTTGRQQSQRYDNLLEDVTAVRHSGEGWQVKNGGEWVDAGEAELAEVRRFLPKEDQPKFDDWRQGRERTGAGQEDAERARQHDDALQQLEALHETQRNLERGMRDALITDFGMRADEINAQGHVLPMAAREARVSPADNPAAQAMQRRIDEYRGARAAASEMTKRAQELAQAPASKAATFKFSAPLEVGSGGMRQHYDEAMVNIANKLGKKYDAQVGKSNVRSGLEPVTLATGGNTFAARESAETWIQEQKKLGRDVSDYEVRSTHGGRDAARYYVYKPKHEEVHSFPITEKLRQQVLEKGLPLAGGSPPITVLGPAAGAGSGAASGDENDSASARMKKIAVGALIGAAGIAVMHPKAAKELLEAAVANTKGASLTEDGAIRLQMSRRQLPEQSGSPSVRGGVFWSPEEKSPYAKHYTGKGGYGGPDTKTATGEFSNPIVVAAGTGGRAPQLAYDHVVGKGAYEKMRTEVLKSLPHYGQRANIGELRDTLNRLGGNGDLAGDIAQFSTKGNQFAYAMQENIVAHTLKQAGHDAVIAYSKSGGKPRLSEVFDLKTTEYPAALPLGAAGIGAAAMASQNATGETTHLAPPEEKKFQAWVAANKDVQGIKGWDEAPYDMRGFWKDKKALAAWKPGEHFPDTYKQHGHPTFSVESKYSKGANDGGRWDGETFIPAKKVK